MSRVRLRERETRARYLPEICMVCGEPSQTQIRKNFSWFPPWVGVTILLGILPYAILAAMLTKKMQVEVPVCQRHGGYFWKRTLLIWLVVLGWLGISGLSLAVGIVLSEQNRGAPGADVGIMIGCFSFIVGLLVAIVVISIVQNTTIRPKEITDESITLVAVNDKFVDAMEDGRESRRDSRRQPGVVAPRTMSRASATASAIDPTTTSRARGGAEMRSTIDSRRSRRRARAK